MKIDEDRFIIVTGAAGFIGSGVIRYLNDKGFKNIIAVDVLGSDERWQNLVGKRICHYLHRDDLMAWLEGREGEIQAFIHLGACSATTERDADFMMRNNYQYTVNLAEYALKHEHRFIYASSAATYGMGEQGFSDDHDFLPHLKPLNVYGYSKHLFDLWALGQGVLNEITGLKYFNVFGPNEFHKGRMSSAVVHFTRQLQKEGELRLFESSEPEKFLDGDQCRDFIYIKDAARMTCSFLKSDLGGIYNIGTGEANTWNTMAEAVIEALGGEGSISYIKMPEDLMGKYQNYTCADMSKWKDLEGAKWPFRKAIIDYVQNYLLPNERW